jgi:hypothetical protein
VKNVTEIPSSKPARLNSLVRARDVGGHLAPPAATQLFDEGVDQPRGETVAPLLGGDRDPLEVARLVKDLVALGTEREADDVAVLDGNEAEARSCSRCSATSRTLQ